MGEMATRKSDGERIKIGTCESMYYLRFDQRGEVTYGWPALSNDVEKLDPFMYRFPDPKEDGTLPGEYESAWGGIKLSIKGFWSQFPEGAVDHGSIQVSAHDGYMFNLPCPEGSPGSYVEKHDGHTPHRFRNGGTTTVVVTAQRWYAGRLVLVVQCAACRDSVRLVELEQVQPILDALQSKGDYHRQQAEYVYLGGPNTSDEIRAQLKANELRDAAYWDEVANRITAGYSA